MPAEVDGGRGPDRRAGVARSRRDGDLVEQPGGDDRSDADAVHRDAPADAQQPGTRPQVLLNLYRPVTTSPQATLDGITVLAHLTETPEQRAEVVARLWRVVIADGTRALTTAGRWSEALRHIEEHCGIGRRILDGRQVAVLARATTGDLPGAHALLEDTEPGDPWENAVTAVLTAAALAVARAVLEDSPFAPVSPGRDPLSRHTPMA
ncbi:hypothetical protein ACIRD3_20080 [Kitasatospora sp. NPDC093550]|uniref:hypothetical protein n=1 Tax=Kitasatospora sp. NPDC093550 TaxID=3364089 RepID=UPI0038129425